MGNVFEMLPRDVKLLILVQRHQPCWEGKVGSMSVLASLLPCRHLLQTPKDHRNYTMYPPATRSFWPEAASAAQDFTCIYLCMTFPNPHVESGLELGPNIQLPVLLSCPQRAGLHPSQMLWSGYVAITGGEGGRRGGRREANAVITELGKD